MNPTPAPYRFHAFDVSYFSAKVRAALRYKGVWYDERRADIPEILRRTGVHYIPILVTPEDETWQDSTDIFDRLEARHPTPPLFPPTPVQRIAAHLVELYVDEFAMLPAMHYRWGVDEGERTTRKRFTAMIGNEERGKQAADQMASARLALGATDSNAAPIEAHMRDLLDALSAHLRAQPFLLGDRASFADCAAMGPFYAHFFVDLPSRRLMLDTAWPVVGWIERCNAPNEDEQGEWLADDALADTLPEVLGVMGRDAAPALVALLEAVETWADTRPDPLDAMPRAVGKIPLELRGTSYERVVLPYALFSVQRVLDAYRGLSDADRARVDATLAGTGWEPLLAYTPRHRIRREGFQLVFE